MIVKDFDFRGILTANKLSKYRDHGPGGGAAGTTRTERARAGWCAGRTSKSTALVRHARRKESYLGKRLS
jgi:hypothetical protein